MKAFISSSGLLALLVAAVGFPGSATQAQEAASADLAACLRETDDQLRLACFDRIAAGMAPVEPPAEASTIEAAPGPAKAPPPAATTAAPADLPAASPTKASPTAPATAVAPAAAPASATATDAQPPPAPEAASPESTPPAAESGEYTAAVTKIDVQPRGEHMVFLANGEVWQQNEKTRFFPVEVGDSVTIRERRFGGHRLVTESGRAYAVKRIR